MMTQVKKIFFFFSILSTYVGFSKSLLVTDFAYVTVRSREVNLSLFPEFLDSSKKKELRDLLSGKLKKELGVSEVFFQEKDAPIEFYQNVVKRSSPVTFNDLKNVAKNLKDFKNQRKLYGDYAPWNFLERKQALRRGNTDIAKADLFAKVTFWLEEYQGLKSKNYPYSLTAEITVRNNEERKGRVFSNKILLKFGVKGRKDVALQERKISEEDNFSLTKGLVENLFAKKYKAAPKIYDIPEDSEFSDFVRSAKVQSIILVDGKFYVQQGKKKGATCTYKIPKLIGERAISGRTNISQVTVVHKSSGTKYKLVSYDYPDTDPKVTHLLKKPKNLDKINELKIKNTKTNVEILLQETLRGRGKIVFLGKDGKDEIKLVSSFARTTIYINGELVGLFQRYAKIMSRDALKSYEYVFFQSKSRLDKKSTELFMNAFGLRAPRLAASFKAKKTPLKIGFGK